MKLIQTSRYFYYGLAAVISLVTLGCEGLDDWSDLKKIDLFENFSEDGQGGNAFKRYETPIMSSQPLVEFIY